MYSKIALFVASAFALGAMAAPGGPAPVSGGNQCSTGEVNCCNTVQNANSSGVQNLLGLVGLGSVTGLVGLGCTSANVLGLGGNKCTTQTVCCQNNHFEGLIVVGCSPINL